MVENTKPTVTQKDRIITIIGPTASGKTKRAVALAKYLDAEIISADSRQVYRDMDLGTGKDLKEYENVPYHLIDIVNAGEKYNLHRYLKDFNKAKDEILSRRKKVIICGGTGLYLETALSGINLPYVPENKELRKKLENLSLIDLSEILKQYKQLHNTTDIDTAKRAIRAIEIEEFYRLHPDLAIETKKSKCKTLNSVIIGIDIPRDKRRDRISFRLESRLNEGMLEEVIKLLDRGIPAEDLIYYGLEYKYLTLHAIGQLTFDEMKKQLEIAIHQFSKRQMTWFRGMERRGFKINWLPYYLSQEDFLQEVIKLI